MKTIVELPARPSEIALGLLVKSLFRDHNPWWIEQEILETLNLIQNHWVIIQQAYYAMKLPSHPDILKKE